jgi:quercetin dioxygenase-like cupin family protein
MIIKHDSEMTPVPVVMEGAAAVSMCIPVGPEDGSHNMIMRLFRIAPGGHTPYHVHDFEHLVRVVSGKGIVTDEAGNTYELSLGQSVFVAPNEKHQFSNPNDEPFEFTCTILNPNARCCSK